MPFLALISGRELDLLIRVQTVPFKEKKKLQFWAWHVFDVCSIVETGCLARERVLGKCEGPVVMGLQPIPTFWNAWPFHVKTA